MLECTHRFTGGILVVWTPCGTDHPALVVLWNSTQDERYFTLVSGEEDRRQRLCSCERKSSSQWLLAYVSV